MSTESGAGGTNTMSWTLAIPFDWAAQAVAVKPVGSGVGGGVGGGGTARSHMVM